MFRNFCFFVIVVFLAMTVLATDVNLFIGSFDTDQTAYIGRNLDFNVQIVNYYGIDKNISLVLKDGSSKVVDTNTLIPADSNLLTKISYIPTTIIGWHDLNLLLFSDGVLADFKTKRIGVQEISSDIVVEQINIPTKMVVEEEAGITVILKNNGIPATKLVKIYHGNTDAENLLFLQYISFPTAEQKSVYFTFTPHITGNDIMIVMIEGTIIREELFTVVLGGELPGAAYTVSLYLQKGSESCVTVLNNGDKFFFKEISPDENGFKVSFTLTDKFGTIVLDTYGRGGDEFIEKARTIRIITVGEFASNLIMAYSYPISVSYSTCTTSLSDLVDKLDKCESSLRGLSTNVSECEIKRGTAENSAQEYHKQLDIANTALSQRTQDIGQLTTTINDNDKICSTKINSALVLKEETVNSISNELSTLKNTTIPALESETNSWVVVGVILGVFFAAACCFIAYLVYLRGGLK